MRSSLIASLVIFALAVSTLQPLAWAEEETQAKEIDMSMYMGDPERGPEPDPKFKDHPKPPHAPTNVRTDGDPIKEYGHWRLNKRVLYPPLTPFRTMEYDELKKIRDFYESKPWKDGKLLRYSLLTPPESAKKPEGGWPLVILMPGVGGIGKPDINLHKVNVGHPLVWGSEEFRKRFPAYVVYMQPQARAYNFEDDKSTNGMKDITPTPILSAYEDVIDMLLKEKKDIDPKRVYLSGFSHGGSCTWLLLKRRPEMYAAAAPFAGSPPNQEEEYKIIAKKPIWLTIGNQDTWVGSAQSIFAYNQLKAAGAEKVKLWEIQDVGHSIQMVKILPIAEWLFQQRNEDTE